MWITFFFSSATGVSNDTKAKLIWFGSGFIYARTNLNLYIAAEQKEKARPYYFFLSHDFEHKGMNTVLCHRSLK